LEPKQRIILPLDVDNAPQALRMVEQLKDSVGAFKVGLELVNAAGPGIFEQLAEAGADRIFYDAKLHDIPNTGAGASRSIAARKLWMTNVHASGGLRMVAAAKDALHTTAASLGVAPPLLLAVTLLTSVSADELRDELHVSMDTAEYVVAMAKMAKQAGADGVVASPKEITAIRESCGVGFLIVTPGVRPAWTEAGDQRRVMTPGEAVKLGADYLVIGRPITAAANPADAAKRILEEIEA